MTSTLFVGIDWGKKVHFAHVVDAEGNSLGERQVEHTGAGLGELCEWLGGFGLPVEDIHVGIEVPHGAVVETLLERGYGVYSINPKQADRFRDRYSMSGAKDDRRDAFVLADSLRTDRRCFRRVEAQPSNLIELREWSRIVEELKTELVRLTNRMGQQLDRYYPQFRELSADLSADWVLDVWEKAPSPAKALRCRRSSLSKVLTRTKRFDAEQVLATLRQPGFEVAPGTIEAAVNHIRLLIERLRVVKRQLRASEKQLSLRLEALVSDEAERDGGQRDVTIAASVPGIGPIVLATLLAEAWRPLKDRDYRALRALGGVAPVTSRSGSSHLVVAMRRSCNPRVREALYHWARTSVQWDTACRERYRALRARGHSHARALRSLADRNLRILVAMLRNQTLFCGSA